MSNVQVSFCLVTKGFRARGYQVPSAITFRCIAKRGTFETISSLHVGNAVIGVVPTDSTVLQPEVARNLLVDGKGKLMGIAMSRDGIWDFARKEAAGSSWLPTSPAGRK